MEFLFNQENYYKNEEQQMIALKNQHSEHKRLVRKLKLVELQLLEEASNLKREET